MIPKIHGRDQEIPHGKQPFVLFVCTANICRSPLASALLNRIVSDYFGEAIWRIESAGTWARGGDPVAEEVRFLMQKKGIDLSQHRSRVVDAQLMQAANLILAMESGHKEALRIEFPACSNRIYLVAEMIDQHFDIDDPYGGPMAGYERTAWLLEQILHQGLPKIERLLNR